MPMCYNPSPVFKYSEINSIKNINLMGDMMDRNLKIWSRDSYKQKKKIKILLAFCKGKVQCLSDIHINKAQCECPKRLLFMSYL